MYQINLFRGYGVYIRVSLLLAFLFSFNSGVPAGAQNDGSVESLWSDEVKKTVKPGGSTIDSFKHSALMQGGTWPGIGPFRKDSDALQFTDSENNQIKLFAADEKVIGAQLDLATKPAGDFAGTEMTTDFLLEALGTRPATIYAFNKELEKAKPKVGKGLTKFSAGQFLISIQNKLSDTCALRIQVNNKNAGDIQSNQVSTQSSETSTDQAQEVPVKSAAPSLSTGGNVTKITVRDTKSGIKTAGAAPVQKTQPKTNAAQANSDLNPLHDTFKDLIQKWQQIKKTAVKDRDTSALSTVLIGRALARQTDGIRWLKDNKKYYEMEPRDVEIGHYTELVKDKKYLVSCKIKEASKFYDQSRKTLLRDAVDTYDVNYTIEKAGDHYVISDSAMVTGKPAANAKPAVSTKSTARSKPSNGTKTGAGTKKAN